MYSSTSSEHFDLATAAGYCAQIEPVSCDCGWEDGTRRLSARERLDFNEALTCWFKRCQLGIEISAVYNYCAQFKLNPY